jgi:hypothetical protein
MAENVDGGSSFQGAMIARAFEEAERVSGGYTSSLSCSGGMIVWILDLEFDHRGGRSC